MAAAVVASEGYEAAARLSKEESLHLSGVALAKPSWVLKALVSFSLESLQLNGRLSPDDDYVRSLLWLPAGLPWSRGLGDG